MKFVSLHGHTSFSSGDGHGTPRQHVERVKELGMDTLAITEHGTVSSHVQLEQACLDLGVKPIFGCELYVSEGKNRSKYHQTVLAMNQQGYRQLNRLVTRSWAEGFYQFPTVDLEWLLDPKQTSGLIVLSGCADSLLSCSIVGGKAKGERYTASQLAAEDDMAMRYDAARGVVSDFKEVYGDRYYLEVQRFKNYYPTHYINRALVDLSEELSVPLVGTADVHYPHPDDWEVQRLTNAIKWGTSVEVLAEQREYEAGKCTYPLSDKEMVKDLFDSSVPLELAKTAVMNTRRIAKRCNVTLPKTDPIRYSESDGTQGTSNKLLMQRIKEGVKYRLEFNPIFAADYRSNKKAYIERINKELATIIPKGFADYFLINQQIIGWAKEQGIVVGPGRGSAASSLICYLLRLTEVNPMEFPDMVFERFLDPSRSDDPDIDTDYQDDRRNEVFEYARSVYGEENVGNIGNFSRFRGRTAIKSAAKVLDVPPLDAERYADFIETPPYGDPREFHTAEDAAEAFPEVQAILEQYPELKLGWRLEGDMRSLGIHAAGMVISNKPISETCAIYKRTKTNKDTTEVIAYDKRDAAYLNMLKLDCLGLLTMTIVADVIDMVPDLTLEKLYALPRDDEKVLQAFADDDLTGIFQFEGRSTREIVKKIFKGKGKLPNFMHLADINALSRPGSLISGMTARYIDVENGEAKKSIHPVVDGILASTNGCLVYQEQVMKIGKEFGGLDDSEIGRLRKIIGAKQAGGAFEAFWIKFRDGANKLHGAGEAKAREVWEFMAASASYLFNVSHAICYALVAYWTMFLKVYYPAEFFAASLRSAAKKGKVKGKADPQLLLLKDAAAHGLTVSPPHPTLSKLSWEPNRDRTGLVAGFMQLPGIGEIVATAIMNYKRDNPATEKFIWGDFVREVKGFGPAAEEKAVAMSEKPDPFDIALTNSAIYTVTQAIENGDAPLSPPDATSATIPSQEDVTVTYLGQVLAVKIIDVISEMRSRKNMTTEEVIEALDSPDLATKAKIICGDTGGAEVHVNISRYNYPRLKKEIDEIDSDKLFVIHAQGKAYNGFGPAVSATELTTIELER